MPSPDPDRATDPRPLLTFIIPARGPSKNLHDVVEVLIGLPVSLEVFIIDTSSRNAGDPTLRDFPTDERVRVLSLPGGQPGSARNAGLERATGRWQIFIDDDDYVDESEFRAAIADGCFAERSGILGFGYQEQQGSTVSRSQGRPATPSEVLLAIPLAFWRYGYSRELLSTIQNPFPDGLVGEDIVFLFRALAQQPSIHQCDHAYYVYRRRPKGVSSVRDSRWLVIPRQLRLALDACTTSELKAVWIDVWKRNIVSGFLSTPKRQRGLFLRQTLIVWASLPSSSLRLRAVSAAASQLASQIGSRAIGFIRK